LTITLEGVRQDEGAESAGAVRFAASALARQGRVAYRVALAPIPTGRRDTARGDNRTSERRRIRLRSAKLLDSNNRFLCECLIHDRSNTGLRLKLMKNIGLPSRCRLFDDDTGEVMVVATVWRSETVVGMRYCLSEPTVAISKNLRAALRGRYYAIED
jgi:hypothetical protein